MHSSKIGFLVPLILLSGLGCTIKTETTESDEHPPLDVGVDPSVTPSQPSTTGKGGAVLPVAAAQDSQGVQSEFVVGQILVRPAANGQLESFLKRYDGVVVSDNAVPEPPAELGITLTAAQRDPTEFLVQIDLRSVEPSGFEEDASRVGMGGQLRVSSEDGLRTLAGMADARSEGFRVSLNYLNHYDQAFPSTLFSTQERPSGGGFPDAFNDPSFQSTGNQSNVSLAWQYLSAHGIQRRVRVAIIDDGFYLNPDGTPTSADNDFPANPIQYDLINLDPIADGFNTTPCGTNNPCFWHGTGAAGVATGILNNNLGAAGTGGLVADVMLFKTGSQVANSKRAIRTAILWGADVVSMSFSRDCDSIACREDDRDDPPFQAAVENGSKTVFVSSAGNNSHEVGKPFYVHPCIEDHVLCVGSLNTNPATTLASFSNFGDGVDIFAPTAINVMSYPPSPVGGNPFGTATPQQFGGTSASAPFVAGVAAMMKAIDPNLSSDDVARILRDTGHPGQGNVSRFVDALAAVRQAAVGIDGTHDRFEGAAGNDETRPTSFSGNGPWNEVNLSLHNDGDRDYYYFFNPQRSMVTLELRYPTGLGAIPFEGLEAQGECGDPSLIDNQENATGRLIRYTAPPGPYVFGIGNGRGPVNAYNLSVRADAVGADADSFEPNDSTAEATYLGDFFPIALEDTIYLAPDPEASIDATIHSATDVDYYIVQGKSPTLAEIVLMGGYSAVQITNAESLLTLEAWELNPDGSPGTALLKASAQDCGDELEVRLGDGTYLLKVSGGMGRYHLYNGVIAGGSVVPDLVHDHVYEVLHPGEPVERVLWEDSLWYVFPGDESYQEVRLEGDGLHLKLYDEASQLVAEGTASQDYSEAISLDAARLGQLYALEISPVTVNPEGTAMTLSWGEAEPARQTQNLLVNGGAEEGYGTDDGGAVEYISNWYIPDDADGMPTIVYYNSTTEAGNFPTESDPGPKERGYKMFAGGPGNPSATMTQDINNFFDWYETIDVGKVKFDAIGFLGGYLDQTDSSSIELKFLDATGKLLGSAKLGPVTSMARDDKTGLWPVVASDYVPSTTRLISVTLRFDREEGDYNDGYADGLELFLKEYQ